MPNFEILADCKATFSSDQIWRTLGETLPKKLNSISGFNAPGNNSPDDT